MERQQNGTKVYWVAGQLQRSVFNASQMQTQVLLLSISNNQSMLLLAHTFQVYSILYTSFHFLHKHHYHALEKLDLTHEQTHLQYFPIVE
jgi:hypothetical protein